MKRLIDERPPEQATHFELMLLRSIELDVPPAGAEAALLDRLDGAPVVPIATTNRKLRSSSYLFVLAATIGIFLILLARKRHHDGVVPIVQEEPRAVPVSSDVPAMEMPLPAPKAPTQPFDRSAAAKALGQVNLDECEPLTGPSGDGHVEVMFAPEGNVRWVAVEPPFDGTDRGTCVAAKLAAVRIPAFQGAAVMVGKSFVLP